jgi:hypothetical protein
MPPFDFDRAFELWYFFGSIILTTIQDFLQYHSDNHTTAGIVNDREYDVAKP